MPRTHEERVARFQAVWDRQGFTGRISLDVSGKWALGWYLRPTLERPIAYESANLKNPQHGINLARRKGMRALWLPVNVVPADLTDLYPGAPIPLSKLPTT